jgi:hypothetical protein
MCQATSRPVCELDQATRKSLVESAAVMALSSKVEQREGSHEKLVEMIEQIAGEVMKELKIIDGAIAAEPEKEHSENF